MATEGQTGYRFEWKDLGILEVGRPNLGPNMNIATYRLMQYTLRDVLTARYGDAAAREIFVEAGKLAGAHFCKNLLDTSLSFADFVTDLQKKLKDRRIGVLRVEKADLDKMELALTLIEDLDCSGLPIIGENVCDYDEGFIAGILNTYTGKEFVVKEVDCWASGGAACRFNARLK
jgi:hypothetical protein